MRFFAEAFFDLTTERTDGQIPYFAIVQYGELHGCDEDELTDLLYFVREMDAEYLAYREKKSRVK